MFKFLIVLSDRICVLKFSVFFFLFQTSNAESIVVGPDRAAAVLSEHWYQ